MESSKEKEANLSAIINEDEKLEIYKESKIVYEKKQAKSDASCSSETLLKEEFSPNAPAEKKAKIDDVEGESASTIFERNINTMSDDGAKIFPSTGTMPTEKEIVREDKELPKDSQFYAKIAPIQVIQECFAKQPTDFGPHIRKFIGENNYVRSCKWSSNGRWLSTDSLDRIVRIFEFSSDKELLLHRSVPFGGIVYDLQWTPGSLHTHFITTSKEQPIHCWDAHGALMASFRGINDQDELESAYSLSFSLNGKRIFAGFRNCLRIFDFEREGRQIQQFKNSSKGLLQAQKGIISAIAMCPNFDGVFASASYSGSLGLYSTQTSSCDCLLNTDGTAITHLQYSSNGNFLFVGLRKSSFIRCYDLRWPSKILANYRRSAMTNQRFYFQLDPHDHFLYSGSGTGDLLIFDLKNNDGLSGEKGEPIEATNSIKCSSASICGLSLHPQDEIVAICTGQRIFPDIASQLFPESESPPLFNQKENNEARNGKEIDADDLMEYKYRGRGALLDNSIKLYKFS